MYMYIFHVFDSGAGMGEKSSIRSEMHSTVKCYNPDIWVDDILFWEVAGQAIDL